ncbi:MAG: hypothetical protein KKC18_05600 [Chloroflexi bacterium]|nr:hypothetical protein [Chloroflexota bacterium]
MTRSNDKLATLKRLDRRARPTLAINSAKQHPNPAVRSQGLAPLGHNGGVYGPQGP